MINVFPLSVILGEYQTAQSRGAWHPNVKHGHGTKATGAIFLHTSRDREGVGVVQPGSAPSRSRLV